MKQRFKVQVQAQIDVLADSEEDARDEAISIAVEMEPDEWGTIILPDEVEA